MPMQTRSRPTIAWWTLNTTKRFGLALVFLLLALEGSSLAQQPVQPLPQVGTPADNETNTQAQLPRVGAYNFVFDGSTWDRWTGSVTVSGTVAVTQSGTWTVQPGNTANTTAWKVDGSAVTQPVSGTVTANMGTVTADPFGANADAASATGSISAKLRFIASTGIPITGTVTVGSHAVTNAGTFATQSAITAASGSIASGAIASGAVASGAFASGAIASGAYGSDSGSFGVGSTGSAPPAKGVFNAALGSGATGGLLTGITVCELSKPINISTATTTLMVTGVSGRQVRICAFHMVTAAANNVAWIEGTGATCGTGTAGMAGGTTAASGYNFAANGGIAIGSGLGEVLTTATTGDSVCLVTSAAVQLSGFIKYTIY
jgi:hypothetical protein